MFSFPILYKNMPKNCTYNSKSSKYAKNKGTKMFVYDIMEV